MNMFPKLKSKNTYVPDTEDRFGREHGKTIYFIAENNILEKGSCWHVVDSHGETKIFSVYNDAHPLGVDIYIETLEYWFQCLDKSWFGCIKDQPQVHMSNEEFVARCSELDFNFTCLF